jgi:hypothetical protein
MSKQRTIMRIAKEHLHLETLDTRRSDSLDFSDQAVWCIKAALEAAYDAGYTRGISRIKPLIAAGDELISSIMAAREHWNTGALDEIKPACTDLLNRIEPAKKLLRKARAR